MLRSEEAGDDKNVSDVSRAMSHIIPRYRAQLSLYGVPSGVAQLVSPYFLGYMKGFAMSLVIARCARSSTRSQMRLILDRSLSEAFGDLAETVLHRMVDLYEHGDQEFLQGAESGRIAADAVWNFGDESHPVVSKAWDSIRGRGMDPSSAGVVGKLLDELEEVLLFDHYKPEWMKKR